MIDNVTRGSIAAVLSAILAVCAVAGCSTSGSASNTSTTITMTSASGQAELLLRPRGAVQGLVLFMHGLAATQDQLLLDQQLAPVRGALLAAGFAIAASNSHGNNAGNESSLQDQINLMKDADAKIPGSRPVDILAFSMGGLDALLLASRHIVPGLRSVALLSPVCDQAPFLTGPYSPVIESAFGNASQASLPSVIRANDPTYRPISSYRGYTYAFWHSEADRTVSASQSQRMVERLKLGGVPVSYRPLDGAHGDLSRMRPADVVSLFEGG